MPKGLPNLLGLDRNELASVLAPLDVRPFHAAQIFHQMYGRMETDFRAMTDLPAALRLQLTDRFRIALPGIKTVRRSTDGPKTYLMGLEQHREVESAYLGYGTRDTLCL